MIGCKAVHSNISVFKYIKEFLFFSRHSSKGGNPRIRILQIAVLSGVGPAGADEHNPKQDRKQGNDSFLHLKYPFSYLSTSLPVKQELRYTTHRNCIENLNGIIRTANGFDIYLLSYCFIVLSAIINSYSYIIIVCIHFVEYLLSVS